jgi:hemerythrin-like domain-containing protein
MDTATNVLRNEHKAILRMLEATEETAKRIRHGDNIAPAILSGLLEFLRTFADRCHHGKEEDCLFPLLEQRGLPRGGGPVDVMLHEHEQGRELIRSMTAASEAYAAGRKDAALQWGEAAAKYAVLLRNHIDKENNVLFVMADRLLSESDQKSLVEAFEGIETDKLGAGTHERLHKLMDRLHAEIFASESAGDSPA